MNKKRILITGGSGFIGSHLVNYILENRTDWDIVLLERLGHSGTFHRLYNFESFRVNEIEETGRVDVVWHDLRSPINDFVKKKIGEVDYIVHMAASTHVDRSIENPMDFVLDNVVATANLLDFSRTLSDLKMFINFSTDEVFGPAPFGYNHKESDQHLPSNPYSATKSGARQLAYSYFVTYKLPTVTTYTLNNFGETQHPEKFIPRTISSIMNGEEMPMYATTDENGNVKEISSRFWVYAKNTADAVCYILENGKVGEDYNIVGFDEYNILDLANRISDIIGKPLKPKFVGFYNARPGHDLRYALDGTKLKELGWNPVSNFDEALRQTVEWTIQHPEWM